MAVVSSSGSGVFHWAARRHGGTAARCNGPRVMGGEDQDGRPIATLEHVRCRTRACRIRRRRRRKTKGRHHPKDQKAKVRKARILFFSFFRCLSLFSSQSVFDWGGEKDTIPPDIRTHTHTMPCRSTFSHEKKKTNIPLMIAFRRAVR